MTESEQLLSSLGGSSHRHQKPLHWDPKLEVRAGDPIQGPPLRPMLLLSPSLSPLIRSATHNHPDELGSWTPQRGPQG